jgi:hypothetical protein
MELKNINRSGDNVVASNLTPKGSRPFFSKKHPKIAICSSRSPNEKEFTFFHFQP